MPQVDLMLNGRAHAIVCDEGQEHHLRKLGEFLDQRVKDLASTIGQVGDMRLILMAGLMLADELMDVRARLEERDREIAALREAGGHEAALRQSEERVAQVLDAAAARIEAMASRVVRPL